MNALSFPDAKSIVKSKTFWLNIISAVLLPFLPEELKKPEYVGYFMVGLNIALRFISKGKVVLM